MQVLELLGAAVLAVSLGANALLTLKLKESKKAPQSQTSYEVRQLLHDLTVGDALVRVSRVAPEDVFLRSPREFHND